MKKKYYGFNGERLVYIGDFESIDDAFNFAELEMIKDRFFYITDVEEWKEIIETMKENIACNYL